MGLSDFLGVNGYVINNSNASILDFLPSELLSRIDNLITLLKITGIVIIAYIAFLVIKWFFGVRRHRKVNKIYKKVYEIDAKLNVLLKRKDALKTKEPERKKGFIRRLFKKENKTNLSKRFDPKDKPLKKVIVKNKKKKK